MNSPHSPKTLTASEKLLLALDSFPLGAIWRVAVGFATFPFLEYLFGPRNSALLTAAGLLGVLLLLRILPALVRKLLPFSTEVKQVWLDRRSIGKRYDSYQWQKLFWIGIGLSLYIVQSHNFSTDRIAIASACVVFGAAGMARWRFVAARIDSRRSAVI